MRRLSTGIGALLALAACAAPRPQPSIALWRPEPSPALESCLEGLRAGLADAGCGELVQWRTVRVADPAQLQRELAAQSGAPPSLHVVCSSPLAAALCRAAPSEPVLIAYCFDPIAAAADPTTGRLPSFACGVASPPPVLQAMELLLRLQPPPRRVGVVLSPDEAIATRQAETARAALEQAGVELVTVHAASAAQVQAAAEQLVALGVDAAWKLSDRTTAADAEGLLRTFAAAGIPTVGDRQAQLAHGAFAALEVDFEAAGRVAGRLAARLLSGADPATIGALPSPAARVVVDEARLSELGRSLRSPRR